MLVFLNNRALKGLFCLRIGLNKVYVFSKSGECDAVRALCEFHASEIGADLDTIYGENEPPYLTIARWIDRYQLETGTCKKTSLKRGVK